MSQLTMKSMCFLRYLMSKPASLLLLASTSIAYGPYYARDVNDTAGAITATGFVTGTASGTGFGSLISSTGNGPPRSTSLTNISGSNPSASSVTSSVDTSNAGHQGPTTTTQIPPDSSHSFSTDSSTITLPNSSSDLITQSTSSLPTSTNGHALIIPFTIKATDGSDRSTAITWSAVETGSTSTTDQSGNPTIIPAPFWTCQDPLCKGTGCVLAIFCSAGGGGTGGFGGFPPPEPPSEPPPKTDSDSSSGSESQNPSTTSTSASSSSSSTSSVSSSSSSSTCGSITTIVDPGPTPIGGSDDASLRFRRRTLVAREIISVNRIETCELTNPVKMPLYLGFKAAMNLARQPRGQNGANILIYDAIEKWYPENLAVDGGPFSGDKVDVTFNAANGPGSIDHVWEKSNVVDFLSSLLGSNFDCDDLNALFSCGNKLQRIFDQLPSMDPNNLQTGFAAMNRNLNGMKGWMFSQGFDDDRFKKLYDSDEKVIQGLERQAIIFNLFNTDSGIQKMHDEANNRIYSAFLALDEYISTNNIQRANSRGDLTQNFGSTFKSWYTQLLIDTGSKTFAWASDQVTRIDADTSLPQCLRKAITRVRLSPLYGPHKFQIDQSHLSWASNPITLKRDRLLEREGACALPTKTSSTSSSPSTTSSTSAFPSESGTTGSAPNESIVCQDPGQASFQLTDATTHFDEYCAHFDDQIYPAITNHVSALREFYDNHAGVWVELWSNIAANDSCKQGEVRFSRGDCLTALGDAANRCKNDDGTSTGGNAEPFKCANFGFIGNTDAPGPDATAAAVTTSEPVPTGTIIAR